MNGPFSKAEFNGRCLKDNDCFPLSQGGKERARIASAKSSRRQIADFARRAKMSHFFLVERSGKSPALMALSRARKRGGSTVTKRWARGAMGASCHKASDIARTAKSCGPDARIAGVKSLRG